MIHKYSKLPLIKQAQFSECGHACIAMISQYYGHKIDLGTLRQLDEPSINGSNMLDLIRILNKLQLNAKALRVELQQLKLVRCPAILHWNMNHFVVLKSVSSKYTIIHDPAVGKRKISFAKLSSSFTGIVLEVEKANDFSAIHAMNTFRIIDIIKGIKGLKHSLSVLLVMSMAIEVFVLINPIFLQYITDNITTTNSLNNLYVIATGFILLTLCHTITEYMRSHFVVYLTMKMSEYLSSGLMNHLLKLPFSYFERRHKGDILSRFNSMNEIQSKITTDSINSLLDGVVILLSLIIMMIYSFQLSFIVILSLTVYLTIRMISYIHLKNQTEISVGEHANINSKFLEIIQCIMPIKLYSKESAMYSDWKNYFTKAMNADIKIARANVLYNTSNLFVLNIEYIVVVSIGAILVTHNLFSVGMLIAFLAYRQTLVTKAITFMNKMFEYKLITVQIDRVADIITQPPENQGICATIKHDIKGNIEVQNLEYNYPGTKQYILNNLNFQINQAEKVVITGPSGIGKTTLLKIMLGLITPTNGAVLIDNIALNHLNLKQYRNACASVMQDDSLISGSILDNITFMESNIDIDLVYFVAKIAEIHHDIANMPMSYETLIGDMGSSLSGGQKQRVLLARALYKNPKLLFLDEATSHLDVETEIKINNALKQLQITQIVIAHREETIKMADRIIELR